MSENKINSNTEEINTSINNRSFRNNIMCNHCMFNCENYEKMKEHYKSEFHKYNLNRVTMNLSPIDYETYLKKKELFMKKMEEQKSKEKLDSNNNVNLYCDVCDKKFNCSNKLNEHLNSKNHKKKIQEQSKKKINNNVNINDNKDNNNNNNEEEIKTESKAENNNNEKPKEEKKLLTTLDNINICLFCNTELENLEKNIFHMINIHHLDVPFIFAIKNYTALIKLMSKKIFTYHACLTCDTQKFQSIKALQSHMLDKNHVSINNNDLDEYLFKYYNYKKLLSIKNINIRKTKEFKIILLRAKVAKRLKEKDIDGNDDWVDIEEEEDDFEPMELPNGELLLENGERLGNKIYNIYYKQRIRIMKNEHLINDLKRNKKLIRKNKFRKNYNRRSNIRNINYRVVKGSNKSNFERINTLTVMRSQFGLV